MRYFNTTGPVRADEHYSIPPLDRLNLDDVLTLVRQKRYFVLHAPRQTGKTSALLALRDLLNGGEAGDFRCVYANVELAQAARENVEDAMRAILTELAIRARVTLRDESLASLWPSVLSSAGPNGVLREVLSRWCEADSTPLVLFIDEIDSLVGDTLLSVLRQLRAGYDQRPESFPHSVVLCGVRDVRDYRIHSSTEKAIIAGGSAFNIKAESLRLGDFSQDEVRTLLAQHTEETGQAFGPEAQRAVWSETEGQPWLVNALGYQACFRDLAGRDRDRTITVGNIFAAREQLIVRRETHLDQLADKLQGRPGTPRRRAAPERRRRERELGPRPRVRARPRPGRAASPAAHREPHLRRGHTAGAHLGGAGNVAPGDRLVRRCGRRS